MTTTTTRTTTHRRLTKKERRDKTIAKIIYNLGVGICSIIGGGLIGALVPLTVYAIAPGLDFNDFLIFVIIGCFIGMCIMACLGYFLKKGVYKLLCKITEK